jgi:hypothetical protein
MKIIGKVIILSIDFVIEILEHIFNAEFIFGVDEGEHEII